MTTELRFVPSTVELRTVEGKPTVIAGYGAVFNKLSQDLGGFVERLMPGAFTKTLRESDVLATVNHDRQNILGRMSSGTLRLTQDERGLPYEIDPPDTGYARDVSALIARGDITGSSFGFRKINDEWGISEQGYPMRSLVEVALGDVGPVTSPAYLDTTTAMRCAAFSSLSELRSISPEEVVAIVDAGELRQLIEGKHVSKPVETTPSTFLAEARLTLARRSLASRPH